MDFFVHSYIFSVCPPFPHGRLQPSTPAATTWPTRSRLPAYAPAPYALLLRAASGTRAGRRLVTPQATAPSRASDEDKFQDRCHARVKL
jgi:hypothetical protein